MGTLLNGVNVVTAILGWTALLLLCCGKGRMGIGPWRVPFTLWVAHATLYLTSVEVARLWFGYVGPSLVATSWSFALYMQAFLSVLGAMVVFRRKA